MSLPRSDSEQNSFEFLNTAPIEGTPRDENIRLNEERSIIASTIALHGVQAVADGDLKYVTALLHRAAELAGDTVPIAKFLKITNDEGYNMLHAAVCYKNVEIMELIFDYGTNITDLPTKDKFEDTPLTLAVKNFVIFHNLSAKMRDSVSACLSISIQIVQDLLAMGANVNGANARGDTPLILAAKLQNSELVIQICKNQGVKINKQNGLGKSALHYAAGSNNTEIGLILLEHDASVLVEDAEGYTPVHTACKYGREEMLQLLLNKRTKFVKDLLEKVTHDGKTPLLVAKNAFNYSLRNIQTLIYTGSRLSAVDKYKNSILHLYSTKDDVGIHEYILGKEPSLLNLTNYNLETPLHITAAYGHSETCLFYMERGASFKAKDINNYTPIMRAIACGHQPVVKMFLEFGCKVDSVVRHQKTLLEWAIENEYNVLIEALCEHDVASAFHDIYCNGLNIIDLAAKIGQKSTLQLMLQINAAKCLVDPKEHYGRSLCIAVEHGHLNCVKLLFEECNDEVSGNMEHNDDTPLHIACRYGHLEIVKYLLSQKASPDICNLTEGTALSCAAANGHDTIVQYLLNNGASTAGGYHKNDLKVTPLLLAAKNGHTNVVKILLQCDVEINLRNSYGRNFLCEAIINGHQSTVFAILNNDVYWRQAMRFKTDSNCTPMRLLVEHMPEMAEVALSRCVSVNYNTDSKGHRRVDHITYSFEFIEDFDTPYTTIAGFLRHIGVLKSASMMQLDDQSSDSDVFTMRFIGNNPGDKIDSNTVTRLQEQDYCNEEWMQSSYNAENHVLHLMVKQKNMNLLKHPVTSELLKYKWKTYGLPIFAINFMVHVFFVCLLTMVVLIPPLPQRQECQTTANSTVEKECSGNCCVTIATDLNWTVERESLDDQGIKNFLFAAVVIIVTISSLLICIKIYKFIRRRRSFVMDLSQWIEMCLYVTSICFVLMLYKNTETCCACICDVTWRFGVFAVFFGWTTLIVELKKFPVTGIIINMLSSITVTFIKLIPVAVLLIFTFALPFHMLLAQPVIVSDDGMTQGKRTPFADIGRSMLKTLVMTTGEFEFDTIYNNEELASEISLPYPIEFTILWVVFIIMMPILFSNLLVGLAVGDTQEELDKAELTKYELRVRTVLELENTFNMLRCLYKITEKTLYDTRCWQDYFRGSRRLKRRAARIDEWKSRGDFSQLIEGEEMIDPLEKIEEKISLLYSKHSERLDRVEALLTNLMKRFDDPDPDAVSYSHSDAKQKRKRAQTLEAALSIKTKSSS